MELSDNHRLYLQTIFDYFHTKGTWPTPRYLEGAFFEKNPELNIDEVADSFPSGYVQVSSSSGSVYSGGPVLTVPAMYLCQGSEEDLKDFIQAVRFCIEKYLKFDEQPQIASDELSHELILSPLSAQKAMKLLPFEPRMFSSATSGGNQVTRYGIAKEILRFQGVETIEQYLEKRDQYKKLPEAEMTQTVELSTENDKHYSISGDLTGKKRVKLPSTWEDLIAELQKLNAVASTIQQLDEDGFPSSGLEDSLITRFVSDYLDWYSDCLALLPEDLKDQFRSVYEKSVKDFLISPTDSYSVVNEYEQVRYFFRYEYADYFYKPFFTQRQILLEASKRALKPDRVSTIFEAVDAVVLIARRFGLIARTLEQRRSGQEPLIIANEYDAQYLFKGLLKLFFEDVRPEEWTPSYAGKSTRMDFLIKSEQIVVELKMTREGLKTASQVGEELIIDIHHYRSHHNCKTLVAFVYDPNKFIGEPKSLENDLSQTFNGMLVKVIVTQG